MYTKLDSIAWQGLDIESGADSLLLPQAKSLLHPSVPTYVTTEGSSAAPYITNKVLFENASVDHNCCLEELYVLNAAPRAAEMNKTSSQWIEPRRVIGPLTSISNLCDIGEYHIYYQHCDNERSCIVSQSCLWDG